MTKLGPFISLVLIILSNCRHTTNTINHHEMNALEGRWKFDTVQRNVERLMVMTEEALVLRQQAIAFVKQIDQGTINPDHLSSQSLRSLSTSLSQYLTLRKKREFLARNSIRFRIVAKYARR